MVHHGPADKCLLLQTQWRQCPRGPLWQQEARVPTPAFQAGNSAPQVPGLKQGKVSILGLQLAG